MIPQCYFSVNKARARIKTYFENWFYKNGEENIETQHVKLPAESSAVTVAAFTVCPLVKLLTLRKQQGSDGHV